MRQYKICKDTSGNKSWYLVDHLGSTNVVIDSTGSLVERSLYYPFGGYRSGIADEKYGFTGKEFDSDIGLYYYGARYYSPDTFVFTQADTVLPDVYNPQALNRYSYCLNNPLKYEDPDGHAFGIDDALAGAGILCILMIFVLYIGYSYEYTYPLIESQSESGNYSYEAISKTNIKVNAEAFRGGVSSAAGIAGYCYGIYNTGNPNTATATAASFSATGSTAGGIYCRLAEGYVGEMTFTEMFMYAYNPYFIIDDSTAAVVCELLPDSLGVPISAQQTSESLNMSIVMSNSSDGKLSAWEITHPLTTLRKQLHSKDNTQKTEKDIKKKDCN